MESEMYDVKEGLARGYDRKYQKYIQKFYVFQSVH
jgi:hypothetical protein